MLITTGRVSACGCVEINSANLREGTVVTVLAAQNGEVFEVTPDDEAKLLAAIADFERGELVSASEVLDEIQKS